MSAVARSRKEAAALSEVLGDKPVVRPRAGSLQNPGAATALANGRAVCELIRKGRRLGGASSPSSFPLQTLRIIVQA